MKESKILKLKKPPKQKEKLRLALDIGTNSIGWALYKLNSKGKPSSISGAGVRIFPSGRKDKDYSTLAATRRQKRLQRRQRDRYLQRRAYVLNLLKKSGLFPKDKFSGKQLEKLNPYELRAKGLDKKLELHHFGRALFHINQRRGFKSNRKTGDAKEKGIINQTIKTSKEAMEKDNSRTYGEFLYKRLKKMDNSRKKPGSQQNYWVLARKPVGSSIKDNYAVYAQRQMLKDEFNQLWDFQSRFHEKLKNKNLKDKFCEAIFHQRNLKKPIVGLCSLTKEKRISKALPSFQKFRILKELNNLSYIDSTGNSTRIVEMKKGVEFRDKIIKELFYKKSKVTFKDLEKAFKNFFSNEGENFSGFNLSSAIREDLEGDKARAVLQKVIPNWSNWNLKIQDQFIEKLEGENVEGAFMKEDEEVLEDLKEFNNNNQLGLSKKQLDACLEQINKLPDGHGSFSKKAIYKIIPYLEKGHLESEAIPLAGWGHHSDKKYKGKLYKKLPKYQEVLDSHCIEMSSNPQKKSNKRIPNPTVHIAFNQLRLIVNEIIWTYGRPDQIIIETARELPMGEKTNSEHSKRQKTNKKRNDEVREACKEFKIERPSRSDLFRYKLWKEQKEECLYSGKKIPQSKVWSSELEIDHILPQSQTLDDSYSNKALVYKSSNQGKNDQTPYDYFSQNKKQWVDILSRVKNLSKSKQWRFQKNAMEVFLAEHNNFLARQLNDTRYISKYAKEYLERICNNVWSVRGQTTSIVRDSLFGRKETSYLGKNRDDHRNHAIDAFVIGLIDRTYIQNISKVAKKVEGQDKSKMENIRKILKLDKNILPWTSFKKDVENCLNKVIVSHKKKHKRPDKNSLQTTGQLHNDTAYGFSSKETDFSKAIDVIHYIGILDKKWDKKQIEGIVSDKIRTDFLDELNKNKNLSKEFLIKYHNKTGIRRIRIKEKQTVIPIKNQSGKIYKAFNGDSNYAMELFENSKGKWEGRIIDQFTANQKTFQPIPTRKSLIINDMIFFEDKFWRVVTLSKQQIALSEHFEANTSYRKEKKYYKYTYKTPGSLQKLSPKRVDISPCGKVKLSSFNLSEKKISKTSGA